MFTDKLNLNDDKTEFLIIGTRQQVSKVHIEKLSVGDVSVTPATVARNLGTWFDTNFSLVMHIAKTCKAAFYHLYNIRRIRKFLTMKSTKVLVQAFIMGRIDYCNSLLYVLPATHINKLQRVQNAAARLICSIPCFSHVTPVLYSLHWLPAQFRIDFKILMIAFKAIHGHAPEYICNLIHIKSGNPKISRIGRQKRKNNFFLFSPKELFWLTIFGNDIKRFDFLFLYSKFTKPENSATGPSTKAIRLKIWHMFNTLVRTHQTSS